jgi:hypothetical protein
MLTPKADAPCGLDTKKPRLRVSQGFIIRFKPRESLAEIWLSGRLLALSIFEAFHLGRPDFFPNPSASLIHVLASLAK